MAIDQMLLESVDKSQVATLRLYGWSEPTLSLGYFQNLHDRHQHELSRKLAIVRRATGGGAIIHHHELTYSIAVPIDSTSLGANRTLYDKVHRAMIDSLAELAIHASTYADTAHADTATCENAHRPFLCFMCRSDDDLIVNGYKILGSAQRKSRHAILQHGSLLVQASPHATELPGIIELTGLSPSMGEIADRFTEHVQGALSLEFIDQQLGDAELRRANEIAASRFGSTKWTSRR